MEQEARALQRFAQSLLIAMAEEEPGQRQHRPSHNKVYTTVRYPSAKPSSIASDTLLWERAHAAGTVTVRRISLVTSG